VAQYKPEDLASPQAFERDPKLIWTGMPGGAQRSKPCGPNAGHYALAEMARHISDFTLITQNVDGCIHGGSSPVIELHGKYQRVRCSECGEFAEEIGMDDGVNVPRCSSCADAQAACGLVGEPCRVLKLENRDRKPHENARCLLHRALQVWSNLPPPLAYAPGIIAARWLLN